MPEARPRQKGLMPQSLIDRARLPALEILEGSQTILYFYFPLADKFSSNLIGFSLCLGCYSYCGYPPVRGHALFLVFGGFGTLLFPNGRFLEEFKDGSGGLSFVTALPLGYIVRHSLS